MFQSSLTSQPSEVLTTTTHWRRGRRWEGMAWKTACPMLLNTSFCFWMASWHVAYVIVVMQFF